MIRGLYTAVSGLITQEAKQSVITQNMANANTTGYKSDNLMIKRFNDVMIQNYDKVVGGNNVKNKIGTLSYGSKIDETVTDFTQGVIQNTDSETDFAIEGRGFFTVARQNAAGETSYFYTRDGEFHVNAKGYLVNSSGDSVMATNSNTGSFEPVYVGNKQIAMDNNNNLVLNNQISYKFDLVDFDDLNALVKVGDNLYSGTGAKAAAGASVQNKAIEKSNVNITNEMVNMMTVLRTFESNQKIIQSMDETLGKVVNEVGSVR